VRVAHGPRTFSCLRIHSAVVLVVFVVSRVHVHHYRTQRLYRKRIQHLPSILIHEL
jgi:hypothetical protein